MQRAFTLITVALAYGSHSDPAQVPASYLVSSDLFPFMSGALDPDYASYRRIPDTIFSITLEPVMDTLSAVALAFVVGLCLSLPAVERNGNSLYNPDSDFSRSLIRSFIPLSSLMLPLYTSAEPSQI